MGYGEFGGDGSVFAAVHLKIPDPAATQEGPAATVLMNAQGIGQLSPRALAAAPPAAAGGRAFRGKATQPAFDQKSADDPKNVFTVTVRFADAAELAAAQAAFAAATAPGEVEFTVKVKRNTPGQVHVNWED